MCHGSSGHWAERLRPIVSSLSAPSKSLLGQGEQEKTNGKSESNGLERGAGDIGLEDADAVALRDYGWSLSESRDLRPIGI
jgi:hypothetical protein